MNFAHIPVLLDECLAGLDIKPHGVYIDGTIGGGGHAVKIAERLDGTGRLLGIDRDSFAFRAAGEALARAGYTNADIVRGNFSDIKEICRENGILEVDGVLLDLGVSSYQLDEPGRGFSFMRDAPLDMRMNTDDDLSAHTIVNSYDEKRLAHILREYGEERFSARIAARIAAARKEKPVDSTFELVDIIKSAVPRAAREEHKHVATRTFQALRIEVNGELEILRGAVPDIVSLLKPGGRVCVITFHSLEDRIVKNTLRELADPCVCPRDLPVCGCGRKPSLKIITRKPVMPSDSEVSSNQRARSAKLRIAEKIYTHD